MTTTEARAAAVAKMKAAEKANRASAPKIVRDKRKPNPKNDAYPAPQADKQADTEEITVIGAMTAKPKKTGKKAGKEADKQADKKADIKKPSKSEAAVARVQDLPAPTVVVKSNSAPGVEIATELQAVFDRLNDKLFENKVEPCVLVLAKLKRSYGHFWHSQFARRSQLKGRVHEIGIDLRRLAEERHATDLEVMSTIAHEMAHAMVFQLDKAEADEKGADFKPKTYHCHVWAALMNKIGLKPIAIGSDGLPTGKETGQNASHEIVKGGPFETVGKALLAEGFKFNWASVGGFYDENGRPVVIKIGKGGSVEVGDQPEPKARKKKAGAKAKHTCPTCGANAWGAPSLHLTCTGKDDKKHEPVEMTCDRDEYEGDGEE